jgi:hypothetical protein
MSQPDKAAVVELLDRAPFRILQSGKQLTLAFGGLYIASTSLSSKPALVWETEKSYPRYYVPTDSLHDGVKARIEKGSGGQTDPWPQVKLTTVDTINGSKNGAAKAVIEHLSVGPRETTWVRFLEGPLKGFIRFERNEIGELYLRWQNNLASKFNI